MKQLIANKKGMSMVEVVVAVSVFVVVMSGVMGVMTSSRTISENNETARDGYEKAVGNMDKTLYSGVYDGLNVDDTQKVTVSFEATGKTYQNDTGIEVNKITHGTYSAVGIVKAK